jgi:hypothetical protein
MYWDGFFIRELCELAQQSTEHFEQEINSFLITGHHVAAYRLLVGEILQQRRCIYTTSLFL